MEKLQKNRGLGGPKHQRLIYDIITGTRQTLADTVFCLSAQAGLPQSAIVPLVKYISDIKSVKIRECMGPKLIDLFSRLEPRAVIDEVTLALVMALLYALDVSILQRKEEQDGMKTMNLEL
jgi:nuclear pore complex protein Nup205